MTANKKRVMIKNREECGQPNDGINAAFASWAEQMLRDKLSQYHRNVNFGYEDERYSYEVVQESEKAFKLKVTGIYKYAGDDYEDCEPWEMWMPKSACVEVK